MDALTIGVQLLAGALIGACIGMTGIGGGDKHDPKNLDVKVKVGWVKGLNHLYFLYEAHDNYWDFGQPGLHNDICHWALGEDRGGPTRVEAKNFTKSKAKSYNAPPRYEVHCLSLIHI